MVKHNFNGKVDPTVSVKRYTREEMMAHYDSLPKEYRDVVKDTFVPATIEVKDGVLREPKYYRDLLEKAQRESTRRTYGADHPQAA